MTNESQLNLRNRISTPKLSAAFFRRGGGQETLVELKNIPMMKCETHMLNE